MNHNSVASLRVYAFLLLFAHFESFENIVLCQNMAIKVCTSNLSEIFQRLEGRTQETKFKECTALQEAINCISVPRCSGELLGSFRSILLITASLMKGGNLCPDLKCNELKRYLRGDSASCANNATVSFDDCNRRCTCYNGELVLCRRIRKEFTTMSFKERHRFVRGLRAAATNPVYKEEYRRLCKLHSRMPSMFLHHMPQIFLPWHRWYLLEFENFLRQIDCGITIPYLDWSKNVEHWARGTETKDVWSPSPYGLGGDGHLPQGCVMDGPFNEGVFHIPERIGEGCLKRNFNLSCFLPSKDQIQDAINDSNFTVFENFIRDKIHPSFHDCVGGHMLKHHSASFTPEFWIHHSFIDKLWAAWQSKHDRQKFEYFTKVSFEMPLTERYPWELLDNDGLPGDVRVSYEPIVNSSGKEKKG